MVKKLIAALVLLAAAIAGTLTALTYHSTPDVEALVFEPPRAIEPFQLTDQDQHPFGLLQLQQHWTLMFVGYTYCPDICPTTLAKLAGIYPQLLQQIPNLQVVMVSADPQRDHSERLREYVHYFNPAFIGVTGEHAALLPFTRTLGLVYAMTDAERQDYLIDHSASLVLIDSQGRHRASFKPKFDQHVHTFDAQQVSRELPIIVARYGR